jgi:hypothetical protein
MTERSLQVVDREGGAVAAYSSVDSSKAAINRQAKSAISFGSRDR